MAGRGSVGTARAAPAAQPACLPTPLPACLQGKLPQSVLDQVKAATSTDVHHATGARLCCLPTCQRGGETTAGLPPPACSLLSRAPPSALPHPLPCPAGVEVSPGVFKDVPQEAGVRKEYVYAHAPGSVPQGAAASWGGR